MIFSSLDHANWRHRRKSINWRRLDGHRSMCLSNRSPMHSTKVSSVSLILDRLNIWTNPINIFKSEPVNTW